MKHNTCKILLGYVSNISLKCVIFEQLVKPFDFVRCRYLERPLFALINYIQVACFIRSVLLWHLALDRD